MDSQGGPPAAGRRRRGGRDLGTGRRRVGGLAGVWLDLLWDLSPAARIAAVAAAGAAGMILVAALAWRVALGAHAAALARRLDRAAGSGSSILTGWSWRSAPAGRACPVRFAATSADLGRMAVDQAAALAARVPAAKAVPAKPLGQSLASFVVLLAGIGLLALLMPELVATEWRRFTRPMADVPPFSSTEFKVSPGDTKVVYGEELGHPGRHQRDAGRSLGIGPRRSGRPPDGLPMFPEREGAWQTVLAKVTEPSIYYVRAYRARSERYRIDMITVPRIENARLRIVPPAYAHQASYEGPMPEDGVAGLPGTTVTLWLGQQPSAPRRHARPQRRQERQGRELDPDAALDRRRARGCRQLRDHRRRQVRVPRDRREGQASQQSFSGQRDHADRPVSLRPDLAAAAQSLATPTADLPMVLSAEDDCGISRLQLFRSLNDSRPLPADLAVPRDAAAPHGRAGVACRWPGTAWSRAT